MFESFKAEWRCFIEPCKAGLAKVRHVWGNPGMKMVLMHRFINDLPPALAPLRLLTSFFSTTG